MPKINTPYTFYVALRSQSAPNTFQDNPTLAAGDVKVSIDGGAFNDLTTLPTVAPGAGSPRKQVKTQLTAAEMNGNQIGVAFSDVAGAQWCDYYEAIETSPEDLTIANITAAQLSHVKRNQPLAKFTFLMTDSVNHAPVTGKTVTATRRIDGNAFAPGTLSAVTEVGGGLYSVDFAAADMDGKLILLKATAPGCDDTFERIITQP